MARSGAWSVRSISRPGEPDFVETPTLRRSNAHEFVGREVAANRNAAGMFETAVYARYEVSGPGAEAWLDRLLACQLARRRTRAACADACRRPASSWAI